ncbi:C6 transcription factor [Histoplasma capsulatum H143]|uniref:C6 transcription factor n=1 Tax=Ajellomyces capsulatus (strain H143) TaxID=544712 RepID=C6HLX2_AJECH|nr:C6 transcription factor [Histoplasma capsulatum H143]
MAKLAPSVTRQNAAVCGPQWVKIAKDVSVSRRRVSPQSRPFLLQAIHAVTTFSTQERLVQVEELKRLLFTSALLKVQSNIDLLLGLLTYLAWSSDAFLGRADLVSRLMMLAISLVYDLRLFKSSSIDVEVMMSMTQGWAEESPRNLDDETPYGILERQRAVLACFILSSNVSSHLGRQDAIRWTPQMDEALRVITMDNSCPTDKLFVAQVQLQLLKQKAESRPDRQVVTLAKNLVDYIPHKSADASPGETPRVHL